MDGSVGVTQAQRDEKALLEGALDHYCDWLNSMIQNAGEHVYRTGDFTKAEFGEMKVVAKYEGEYLVYVLYVSTGDDGGGAEVTLWFDDESKYDVSPTPQWVLCHATQTFDTRMSLWYEDGALVEKGRVGW